MPHASGHRPGCPAAALRRLLARRSVLLRRLRLAVPGLLMRLLLSAALRLLGARLRQRAALLVLLVLRLSGLGRSGRGCLLVVLPARLVGLLSLLTLLAGLRLVVLLPVRAGLSALLRCLLCRRPRLLLAVPGLLERLRDLLPRQRVLTRPGRLVLLVLPRLLVLPLLLGLLPGRLGLGLRGSSRVRVAVAHRREVERLLRLPLQLLRGLAYVGGHVAVLLDQAVVDRRSGTVLGRHAAFSSQAVDTEPATRVVTRAARRRPYAFPVRALGHNVLLVVYVAAARPGRWCRGSGLRFSPRPSSAGPRRPPRP
ncbi:hypothetical protein TPA0909_50820 [Streptomyces albus]|nr:hypothetical protein TPA0909_50820 [Streptomyces albus]